MRLDIKSVIVGLIVGVALCVLVDGQAQSQPRGERELQEAGRRPAGAPREGQVVPYPRQPELLRVVPGQRPPRYTDLAVGPGGTVYVLDDRTGQIGRVLPGKAPRQYKVFAQLPRDRR